MPIHANVTLHRILATLVMTRAQHIHTVRQKKQELTWNDRVRILLIKNLLCFRQNSTADSTFKLFKAWIAIMTIIYTFFLQWHCMLRHSVYVVVNFSTQVIFIFPLFQLRQHTLLYPKTTEKQKLPEIKNQLQHIYSS